MFYINSTIYRNMVFMFYAKLESSHMATIHITKVKNKVLTNDYKEYIIKS